MSSGSSSRSTGHRSQASQPTTSSTIEKSVTHLLVATKQLLEILTAWSRGEATEVNVSDVYVRLGYEFNIACRAFNSVGVDTSDLGPVPDSLRTILEDTLSNEPSQASLEQYLPRIRDIIVNLLQGLKKKQQRQRQRDRREGSVASASDRPISGASSVTVVESSSSRTNSMRSTRESYSNDQTGSDLPPRMSSAPAMPPSTSRVSERMSPQRTGSSRAIPAQPTQGKEVAQYTNSAVIPGPYNPQRPSTPTEETPPRPRPQQQQDALAALQRGGDLERRASRRFSAYQIQKHLGSTGSGISMIPPAQHSPIPNRGRDTRDIMNAVKTRNSPAMNGSPTRFGNSGSPSRGATRTNRMTDAPSLHISNIPNFAASEAHQDTTISPMMKTPEDKIRSSYIEDDRVIGNGATAPESTPQSHQFTPSQSISKETITSSSTAAIDQVTSKSLTLFLQYKTKVKKVVLADGYEELSIPRLQLAFIDKFNWNTHSNGVDLPDIYIQDPVSGVRYELEDLTDIKDQSVLALNVDAVDDIKRHVDEGMTGLRTLIESLRSTLGDQQSVLQRVSETQQESAKDIARVAAVPTATKSSGPLSQSNSGRLEEVQSLRRDLAVMRQTYSSFVSDMEASMTTLKHKATHIKTAAAVAAVPNFDTNSGRAYVDGGKKQLSDDSEKIINRVDDLQDIVEDLRKDVVTRGVRPLPRQLETVSRDISTATAELKKLQEFIKREKPIWTKIWRNELQVVYDDQKTLNIQEELAADLEDDLEKAAQTFALVEEATKQQNLEKGENGTPTRSASRTLLKPVSVDSNANVDPGKAKDGVLGEVRALQPNHETRLEAIERAEKARQRELAERKEGAFSKELGRFVDEGKLKKSGGIEEAERLRKSKDERIRRDAWEKMQAKGIAPPTPVATTDASPASALAPETETTAQAEQDSIVQSAVVPPPLHPSHEGDETGPNSANSAATTKTHIPTNLDTKSLDDAEAEVDHTNAILSQADNTNAILSRIPSLSSWRTELNVTSPVDELTVSLDSATTAVSNFKPGEQDADSRDDSFISASEEAGEDVKMPGDFPE